MPYETNIWTIKKQRGKYIFSSDGMKAVK